MTKSKQAIQQNNHLDNRLLYLDILKTVALILMPIIHTFSTLEYCDCFNQQLTESIAFQMSILYFFVPGVFMFCMGAGIVLSKNNQPKHYINRGFKLLLIGFLLNIVRGIGVSIFDLINNESFLNTFLTWLFGSDILYFAGLFFLLYGLLKMIKLNDAVIFIISILMLIISTIVAPVYIENEIIQEIIGNFIYINCDSFFPLLSWTIFPMAGIIFTKFFIKSNNKNRFMLISLIVSAIATIATIFFLILINAFDIRLILWGNNDFYVDFLTALINIEMIIAYQSIVYGISKLIKNQTIIRFFNITSKNVNIIYVTHWVLVILVNAVIMLFVDSIIQSGIVVYVIGIILFVLSWWIANLIQKRKSSL